jgi:hypothetical protein
MEIAPSGYAIVNGGERDNGVAMAKAEPNKWLGRYYSLASSFHPEASVVHLPHAMLLVTVGGGGDQQAHKPTRRGRQSESYLRNTLSRA